jgi:hypothetical protein
MALAPAARSGSKLKPIQKRRRSVIAPTVRLQRTDCQTATGTAFRISLPVSGATLKISGKPATYVKTTAESGRPRVQAFCGNCGTPVYSTSPGEGVQPSYVLRVGILRQRDQLMPRRQIWWRSARPWVTQLGELPKQEKQG